MLYQFSLPNPMGARSPSMEAPVEVATVDPAAHAVTAIKFMKNFDGKSVLITGGSSGIGLALATKLASLNADICILARDRAKLETARQKIMAYRKSPSQRFSVLCADVSDRPDVNKTLSNWIGVSGSPDLVVNSAGVVHPGEFLDLSPDTFDWMMDINYHGTVNVVRAVLPTMLQRKSGHIVNISSLVGFLGMYAYTAYSATKFAVRGFSDSLRAEVVRQGVDLSIVFPPDTDTPQFAEENKHKPPLLFALDESSELMSPENVAEAIIKGVRRRQYIITPGFSSWLFFRLTGVLGPLVYPVVDFMVEDARRKVKNNQARYTRHNKINPDQTSNK